MHGVEVGEVVATVNLDRLYQTSHHPQPLHDHMIPKEQNAPHETHTQNCVSGWGGVIESVVIACVSVCMHVRTYTTVGFLTLHYSGPGQLLYNKISSLSCSTIIIIICTLTVTSYTPTLIAYKGWS